MSAETAAMEQLYQQLILDHARDPAGRGLDAAPLPVPGTPWAQSHQVNPTCGDEVTLRVELGPGERSRGRHGEAGPGESGPGEPGRVERGASGLAVARLAWEGQGCSISQASASVLTQLVTGRSVEEAEALGEDFRALMRSRGEGLDEAAADRLGDATAFTGVARYPARIKCALLSWAALRDALLQAVAGEDD